MRKNLLIAILICFLLILLGLFTWQYLSNALSVDQTAKGPKITFSITERGNDYLRAAEKGSQIGQQIPTSLIVDSLGQDLLQFEKKALVVFNKDHYRKYFPLLQEWAQIYREHLNVILVTEGNLTEEERSRLLVSGVHQVFASNVLHQYLDPGPLNYSFFIDEDRRIVHRFTFEEHKWREMVRDIDLFARRSVVPGHLNVKPMELGKPLALAARLAGGKLFDITDFQGKPSIFFLLNPCCRICDKLYPVIESLRARYEGSLNVGLIFSVYNYQTDQMIKEFYDRYGLGQENMENRYIENTRRFIEQNNLEGMTVFFDQNNQLFHQNLFWLTPTVMLVDEDMKLIDIFGVGDEGAMELSELDLKIDEMVHAVF